MHYTELDKERIRKAAIEAAEVLGCSALRMETIITTVLERYGKRRLCGFFTKVGKQSAAPPESEAHDDQTG